MSCGSSRWSTPTTAAPSTTTERVDLLGAVADGAGTPLTSSAEDRGLAKLALVRAALRLRRDRPELFGSYSAVAATGDAAEHALAFDRGGALTVVTRLPVGLAARGGWGETVLPLADGAWTDALTGRTTTATDGAGLRLAEVLGDLPVALLVREDA